MTNPKPPLQPGDRVRAFYCLGGKPKGTVREVSACGEIISFTADEDGTTRQAHVKACRRLKKKQPEVKPEQPRRQKWMNVHDRGEFFLDSEGEAGKWKNTAEFIRTVHLQEIREGESICPKGSVPVSRESLARAYGAAFGEREGDMAENRSAFIRMIKHLNLKETK